MQTSKFFSHVLVETLPWFSNCFSEVVTQYIDHRRSSEMSTKSLVVGKLLIDMSSINH
jgi:hypothetical protein